MGARYLYTRKGNVPPSPRKGEILRWSISMPHKGASMVLAPWYEMLHHTPNDGARMCPTPPPLWGVEPLWGLHLPPPKGGGRGNPKVACS